MGRQAGPGPLSSPSLPSPFTQPTCSACPYLCTWASTATPRSPVPSECSTLTTVSKKVTLILRSTEGVGRGGLRSGRVVKAGQFPCQAAGCCLRSLC